MNVSEDMAKLLPRAPLQQGASRDMGYKRSNTTFMVLMGPDHEHISFVEQILNKS